MAYDVIIAGTGPGGATLAKELSERGCRVLLLERGEALSGDDQAGRDAISDHVITSGGVAVRRGLGVGGSSLLYFATAWDPPLEMFRARGVDIAAELEEAKKELPIAPLPEALLGVRARRILASARELGYGWNPIPKLVLQDRVHAGESPFRCRWNAGRYVEQAIARGAELRTGAKVQRVLLDGTRASGVEVVLHGKIQHISAKSVVLSCGGFGTPAILQASGLKAAGDGFFCDPLIAVSGMLDDLRGADELAMVAGVHLPDEGYMMTDMTLPRADHERLAAFSGLAGRIPPHANVATIMVKAQDEIDGCVVGEEARRDQSDDDRSKLERGFVRAREILEHAGARDVYRSPVTAAHPGGTVRLGELVDSDLQTEYRDLYVCDASVIPERWGLPPSLTIISLAKRLAKHLAGQS